MSKFLIADPVHINKRNFGSLYDFLEDSKSTVILNEDRADWLSLFGDYCTKQDSLREEFEFLQSLSASALFSLSVLEVNIFKSARAEILSLLITRETFNKHPLPTSHKELFDLILEQEPEVLLWNMASSIQWIKFWQPLIKQHNPKFVLVFSGSLIYARTLLELLKNSAPRAFVLESFFTGSDNYIEEKYEPIANNSNLKFKAYYRSLGSNELPDERDRSRNKAINKILTAKNKNVTQPEKNSKQIFSNQNPTILIVGQVINDFSVLEYKGTGLNTLHFYTDAISKILTHTNFNVIFKAHPWERNKDNIKSTLTLDTLKARFCNEEEKAANEKRLFLTEDYNIKSIFQQTDYVAGLNSQALLEAAFEGFQPIQFADAFYGNKGFTSDYLPHELDRFVSDLLGRKIPKKMGIQQFSLYEEFITKALQFSLVSAFPSGKIMLRSIFHIAPQIPLAKPPAVAQGAAPSPVKKAIPQPAAAPKKAPVDDTNTQKKTADVSSVHSKRKPNKKFAKFLKTPKKFFLDSKDPKIRWLNIFFWGKK